MTDNKTAQAARAQAGTNLESVVARILNSLLNEQNIFVIKGSLKELRRVLRDDTLADQIIEYSTLPVKRPCDQKQIKDYPDADLFVVYKDSATCQTPVDGTATLWELPESMEKISIPGSKSPTPPGALKWIVLLVILHQTLQGALMRREIGIRIHRFALYFARLSATTAGRFAVRSITT